MRSSSDSHTDIDMIDCAATLTLQIVRLLRCDLSVEIVEYYMVYLRYSDDAMQYMHDIILL